MQSRSFHHHLVTLALDPVHVSPSRPCGSSSSQALDSLLQLYHAPQDYGELLTARAINSRPSRFFVLHMVAPRPALGPRSRVLARPRLHGVEGLLQLLVRNGLDVLLEGPVPQVDEAQPKPIVAAPRCWVLKLMN